MRRDPTLMPYSPTSVRGLLRVTIAAFCFWVMRSGPTLASEMATFSYDVGDRLSPIGVIDSAGKFTVLSAETPTIIVFWSTWSEPSQEALAAVISGTRQSGTHWQIMPINVDAAGGAKLSAISGALRRTGYATGGLWRDRDLKLTYSWGIHTIPTVIMSGLGGFVPEMTVGWSASFRERIAAAYFAPLPGPDSQSVRPTPDRVTPASRTSPEFRRLFRQGLATQAIDSLMRALRSGSSIAAADLARVLFWRRECADTLGLGALTDSLIWVRPQDYWLLVNRSLQRSDRHDWQGAKLDATAAIGVDSSSAPAWIMLAQASLATGDTAAAKEAADVAWRRNRHSSALLALRARLAGLSGQPKAEAQYWQWVVEASVHRQKALPARAAGAKP